MREQEKKTLLSFDKHNLGRENEILPTHNINIYYFLKCITHAVAHYELINI